VLEPGCLLHGATRVAEAAVVGPDTTLTDCQVGPGARVVRSHATGAVVGAGAEVGPFTYLRPGTRLGRSSKAGAFVEIKASEVGEGSKVPHLSYVVTPPSAPAATSAPPRSSSTTTAAPSTAHRR
jgi:bifunctional UDP-N-acetylglucosamine pyrophosphorylase/glucosamine-1-phosphate N-acetyltransferase